VGDFQVPRDGGVWPAARDFAKLEGGEWQTALSHCDSLIGQNSREAEVRVATYIDRTFGGFGPKQSRNLLQELGLTRYEIPIDSRVTDWLNKFDFPVRLSATALADDGYYNFVSDGIQELCRRCDVMPCILDAIVFSLKDGDGWTEGNVN
jgi:N-glycosylase/DNA lyase